MRVRIAGPAAALALLAGCLNDPQTIGALADAGGGGGGVTDAGPDETGTTTGNDPSRQTGDGSAGGSDGTTGSPAGCSPADAYVPSPFVWIPRGSDAAMLKYDAETMEEVGRYAMRPYDLTESSRTRVSVNLNGDVAVSNRFGGISMFYGNPEDCPEQNGVDGLQTSSAAEDMLAWDDEECRGWHTEFMANSQRPVAWTSGTLDPVACRFEGAEVWTSRTRWMGVVQVFRLDGEDGTILESVDIPEMDPQGNQYGAYGGAVDRDNDFWIISKQDTAPGDLCEITYDGLDVQCWPVPGEVMNYGFTLDRYGRAWIGGSLGNVARFDPADEAWVVAEVGGDLAGVHEAASGALWVGSIEPAGFAVVDPDTLALTEFVDFAPGSGARGVAVDPLGQIWGFSNGGRMLRYRPSDGELIDIKAISPYVHSDNAGIGLKLTVFGE